MPDDLFDLLIKVRDAALTANSNARQIITAYLNRPDFSHAGNSGIAQTRRAQERAAARSWLEWQHCHVLHLQDAELHFRDGTLTVS